MCLKQKEIARERERDIYIYISLEQYMYMIYALIRIYNTRDLDTSPAYLKQYIRVDHGPRFACARFQFKRAKQV